MKSDQLRELLTRRILVMDGAMGTLIQERNLGPDDFGGENYEGCNEYLNLTRPDVIEAIHDQYLESGSDIIETNTFGATNIVLAEYSLETKVQEINEAAARLARLSADRFSTPDRPRFVAGSMGPTTKTITVTGGVTFEELVEAFRGQSVGLIQGGVDLLLLETVQDSLNLKAATIGVFQAMKELNVERPLMISATIEPTGTMLAGQGVEALYTSLEHFPLFSIGLNCATGPEFMTDHIRSLSQMATCLVSVYPNAGLPNEEGLYEETPASLSEKLSRFVEEGWINVIGGCCGTTPAHIAAISKMVQGRKPRIPQQEIGIAISGIDYMVPDRDSRPVIVGERTNVIGSRKFKKLIIDGKFEEAAEIGRAQTKNGAQVIDVCMANPDRDEVSDMEQFIEILNRIVKAPLMIDSTDPKVTETALKRSQGKCIINSINLEDGEERFEQIVPLLKRYGGAVVVGCIDEDPDQGMGVTRQRKLDIAKRSYDLLTQKYKVPARDIIFDPLVFPVGTGDKNYVGSAPETIEGIRLIQEAMPQTRTILGVSNVSFGLPSAGREILNAVFLYHCVQAGLDYAIVNSERLERYPSIPDKDRILAEDLLFNRGPDPIKAFADHFKGKKPVKTKAKTTLPLNERLPLSIVEGSKEGLIDDLNEALLSSPPLEIINGPLMKGMDEVGRLFNNNTLIVAEVLQSAEVMKTAVDHLKQYMDKSDTSSRGKILLATVKGDVHDIGKNLVEIILGNNGYEIINLGIKVLPDQIIKAHRKESPDFIGLSGLLVKSAQQMVVTAQDLQAAGIEVPILVGGAALTQRFTDKKIAAQYSGPVIYAKDAMNGLDVVNQLINPKGRSQLIDKLKQRQEAAQKEVAPSIRKTEAQPQTALKIRSSVTQDLPLPKLPRTERQVIEAAPLEEIFTLINPTTLYGKHLGLRGSLEKLLDQKDKTAVELHEKVESFKAEVIDKKIMIAQGVRQFFPCQSQGDNLLIYDHTDSPKILETFHFPRQPSSERLCLSDYCRQENSGEMDSIAFFALTCGRGVRQLANDWKDAGDYFRSHLLQALAIEAAEAFAEWIHRKVRADWGFPDPPELKPHDLNRSRYRGSRFSFGYPACPDLSDQGKLFRLLDVTRLIALQLTDGDMMDPEASVSALVFHHPEAKYFRTGTD